MNECDDWGHGCHDMATCTNTKGSYTCECNEGADVQKGFKSGLSPIYRQSQIRIAKNVWTSMNEGWQGDGRDCVDDNQCYTGETGCDINAEVNFVTHNIAI